MPNSLPKSRWTTTPSSSTSTRRRHSRRCSKRANRPERTPAEGGEEMQRDREEIPFRPYAPGTQPAYDVPAYGSTHKRHPQESLVRLPHTITETSGPRFSPAHFPPISDLSIMDGKSALGERIIVH